MTRTDVYVTAAIVAWLAGAYWIGAGLRELGAATDRQALATYCSDQVARVYFRDNWERTCGVSAALQSLKD